MIIRHLLFLLLLFCAFASHAQQEAVTKDGRVVYLHADGTWTFAKESSGKGGASGLEIPRIGAQDNIITHTGYSFVYSEPHEQALWVAYELTAEETAKSFDRTDRFQPDPAVSSGTAGDADYAGSGFDRGHLAPAADMGWSSKAMEESFYYSNMSPQSPSFNRGIWKKLEELVRTWAVEYKAVYITTGPVLRAGLPAIGPNRVSVPEYYYKVILDNRGPEVKAVGFLMANQSSSADLRSLAISIDQVEQATGIDFFPLLEDEVEEKVEREVCVPCWKWFGDQATREPVIRQTESTSVQCSGQTQAGARCKRMTKSPNGRCYQHGGN